MALLLVILTIGNVLCFYFKNSITKFLCPVDYGVGGNVKSAELCRKIAEEGIILLKNDYIEANKRALPLSEDKRKVNIFGWGATNAGFVQVGIGSGSSPIYTTNDKTNKNIKLLEAFETAGYQYNKNVINAYEKFHKSPRRTERGSLEAYRLYEPTIDYFSDELIEDAVEFSDTAIVVVSRISGENCVHDQFLTVGEIPTVQDMLYTEHGLMPTDETRTYLELTRHEEDLIDMCAENFDNVILIVNSTNTMHLNVLETDKIDAAISIGVPGECGALAIPDILWGKVSPSGKLSSTHVYNHTTEASFVNHRKQDSNIQYVEDIYIGYKWYETADAEGFWNSAYAQSKWGITKGYKDVVQFPFGYGLSYTEFEWKVKNVSIPNGGTLNKNSKISFSVTVKNTGEFSGKDVVQIYLNPPYKDGGIEKSASKLLAFFKTPELEPNEEYTETINIDLYDLASYDAYDRNGNNFCGYEIENIPGQYYQIKVMTDAHNLKNCAYNVINYRVVNGGIKFENDPVTSTSVINRFTGDTAYAGVPIDGSNVGAETVYLSRQNFEATFPRTRATTPTNTTLINQGFNFVNNSYNQTLMPITNVESNLRLYTKPDGSYATKEELDSGVGLVANEELFEQLSDYNNDEVWEAFISQMSRKELRRLIENGGFRTEAIESIGKPKAIDKDGPAGINEVALADIYGREEWTVFPGQVTLACTWNLDLAHKMGEAVAKEANDTGINGIYAPNVNLYRSAYHGRNFETYSEDAILSGKFAANVIKGAKSGGMYCYLKHFILAELGVNPYLVKTWATEQNLRENYLRPFELAVKEGEANAIMTSYNCLGATWTGASYPLLTEILRNEWGFKGTVITDYNKVYTALECRDGIRAGNDLWLNPRDYTKYPLSTNNPTDMYCAKRAAKNIIYTYVSTYTYAKKCNPDFKRNFVEQPYPWWIPVLISFDVVTVLGCTAWVVVPIVKQKIKKRKSKA